MPVNLSPREWLSVDELGLNYEEVQRARRACRWLRVARCPQPGLREFLVERLAKQSPALAAKINRFGDRQMEDLCRAIMARQGRSLGVLRADQ
jgi:hypothetical protein